MIRMSSRSMGLLVNGYLCSQSKTMDLNRSACATRSILEPVPMVS